MRALDDVGAVGFWTLAESLPQLVWIANAAGDVTFFNQRLLEYSGFTQSPDGSWSWKPVVHPDDVDATEAAWSGSVSTGELYECEHRVRMADGSYRWHVSRASAAPSTVTGERIWFGTATDIHALKQVEEVLRESERRFRDTFENAAVGVAHIGPDGRFLEVNETLCRITGNPRDRLLSLTFQDITHQRDVDAAVQNSLDLFAGVADVVTGDMQWLRLDGDYVWVHVTASMSSTASPGARHLITVIEDIAERKRAEQIARASQRFTRRLLDALAVFVGVLSTDGTLIEINRALEATGMPRDRVIGRVFWETPWWDFSPHLQADVRSAVERAALGDPARFDVPVRVGNDRLMWIDFHLSLLPRDGDAAERLVVSAVDITDRREAARALDESEKRFRSMTNNLPLLVWVHDAEGRQEFVNDTFCQYFDTTHEKMVDGRWKMLMQSDDGPAYAEAFEVSVRERRAFHGEVRVQRGDGHWRLLESWASPRFGVDGNYVGHVGVSVDITDRRTAEDELVQRHVREQQARQRAEFLTELITEMETTETVAARSQRLADVLVSRLVDAAVVDLRSLDSPVLAVAAREPDRERELRAVLDAGRRPDARERGGTAAVEIRLGHDITGEILVEFGGIAERSDRELADQSLLRELAERAGLVLRAARLREGEHQAAIRLQRALLPHRTVDHPALRIATSYVAAADALEVGGDWYETFLLPAGRVGIVVGDVVGHNIEAAVAMGQLRSGLLALAGHIHEPGELLSALDRFADRNDITDYTTACCAVLDPATGELRYASAGHPPMLVVSAAGGSCWLDGAQAPPLGVSADERRPEESITLQQGSLLLAYTDGLVERRHQSIDLGMAHLRQLAEQRIDSTVVDLCDGIISAMTTDGATHEDDIVLLCARFADPGDRGDQVPSEPA